MLRAALWEPALFRPTLFQNTSAVAPLLLAALANLEAKEAVAVARIICNSIRDAFCWIYIWYRCPVIDAVCADCQHPYAVAQFDNRRDLVIIEGLWLKTRNRDHYHSLLAVSYASTSVCCGNGYSMNFSLQINWALSRKQLQLWQCHWVWGTWAFMLEAAFLSIMLLGARQPNHLLDHRLRLGQTYPRFGFWQIPGCKPRGWRDGRGKICSRLLWSPSIHGKKRSPYVPGNIETSAICDRWD